jgi:hypothetical protein
MRTFITIAFLIGILGCQQSKQPEKTYQSPSLIVEDLKYTAYSWYYPSGQWEFYLNYFVVIDKSGHFNIMSRDSMMSKPKYYTGFISDTLRNLINNTFLIDTFKTDYKSAALQNIAYDGFTYCFDYKKENEDRKKFVFIQTRSPLLIQKLSVILDRLLSSTKAIEVDTIDIAHYIEGIKEFSSASLGPPPIEIRPEKWEPIKILK